MINRVLAQVCLTLGQWVPEHNLWLLLRFQKV